MAITERATKTNKSDLTFDAKDHKINTRFVGFIPPRLSKGREMSRLATKYGWGNGRFCHGQILRLFSCMCSYIRWMLNLGWEENGNWINGSRLHDAISTRHRQHGSIWPPLLSLTSAPWPEHGAANTPQKGHGDHANFHTLRQSKVWGLASRQLLRFDYGSKVMSI